jgi:hypothetical protein
MRTHQPEDFVNLSWPELRGTSGGLQFGLIQHVVAAH